MCSIGSGTEMLYGFWGSGRGSRSCSVLLASPKESYAVAFLDSLAMVKDSWVSARCFALAGEQLTCPSCPANYPNLPP